MKKKVLYLNLTLALILFISNYIYLAFGYLTGNRPFLKTLCVIWFGIMAVCNLIYAKKVNAGKSGFVTLMPLGSLLCMLGDIIIGVDFLVGAIIFAVGHICFFGAYTKLFEINKRDMLISSVVFIASAVFLLTCPIIIFPSQMMKYIAVVYALIISLMAGKALSNLIESRNALTLIIAIGSVMFFFSDMMLVFECFVGLTWAGKLCMALYCPAECLLAFSVFVYADRFEALPQTPHKKLSFKK